MSSTSCVLQPPLISALIRKQQIDYRYYAQCIRELGLALLRGNVRGESDIGNDDGMAASASIGKADASNDA